MTTQRNQGLTGAGVLLRGLTVAYRSGRDDTTVVDDVGFDIPAGRTLALVGESGSGKSTVAGTLLGHLRPGSRLVGGTVEVGGSPVFDLSPAALRRFRSGTVAMVPQNAGHALTPSMRVGHQLAEVPAARLLPAESRQERIREAFEHVGLAAGLVRRYPHELSGGQQQRVAIAMALLTRPEVLVLDEPTTGLDVVTQRDILVLLRDLVRELGTATLLVSHDLGVVAAVADEVAIMQAGRLVERAPVEQLYAAPEHPHTRALLGSVPRLPRRAAGVPEAGGAGAEASLQEAEQPILSVEHAVIGYGRATTRPAVDDVSLDLHRGRVLALVGESGSGKSTLAWSLAGLHPLRDGTMRYLDDAGPASLEGQARRRPLRLRQKVQMVFQNADTSLNPRRQVSAAIRRPVRYFRTTDGRSVDATVASVADDVHLPRHLLTRLPMQLSGGQRQRVGIGRAVAARPAVLVADEITTALDVSVQASILELVDSLRSEHDLACLFISHDLAVVHQIADHVMVLHRGRVVEEGPTAAVFAGPNHPYTRQLLTATLDAEPARAREVVEGRAGRDTGPLAGGVDGDDPSDDGWEPVEGTVDLGGGHRVGRWRRAGQPETEGQA